jgi:hypothetical protein
MSFIFGIRAEANTSSNQRFVSFRYVWHGFCLEPTGSQVLSRNINGSEGEAADVARSPGPLALVCGHAYGDAIFGFCP